MTENFTIYNIFSKIALYSIDICMSIVLYFSISVRTVDSPDSPQSGTVVSGMLGDSQLTSESSTFEEIIDLATVPSKPLKGSTQYGDSLMNHSGDSINFATLDNGHMYDGGDADLPVTKPVIAFEENATTRQDVPGNLNYNFKF